MKVYGVGEMSSTNCLKQISSNQKYLILQNHFQPTTPTLSLKLFFMRAKNRANSIIFTLALFIVRPTTQCILLAVQCFYLRGNKDPSALLSTRDKRVAITFQENQILNLGNHYHKYATQVALEILEKF